MTAAARRSRGALVLEHLAAHPELTAGELGRVLGIRGPLRETLHRLEQQGQVVAVTGRSPDQGRTVSRWRLAPPGTVPPPAPAADPEALRRRREQDRVNQRARRARARGLPVQPGMEPPSLRSLPAAAADLPGAACRTADPDLFFGPDAEFVSARGQREAEAKAICAGCPVRTACLDYALDTGQAYGVWGGTNEDERRSILRRQRTAS